MKKIIFLISIILLTLSVKSQIICRENVTDFKAHTYDSCYIKILPTLSITTTDTIVYVKSMSYVNKTVSNDCCVFGTFFNELNYCISFPITYVNLDSIDFYATEALIDTLISDNTWDTDSLINEYK